jgi:hypothetical protein
MFQIDKMLRHAAEILNLKVHKVKEHTTGEIKEVPVPIDLEGTICFVAFKNKMYSNL